LSSFGIVIPMQEICMMGRLRWQWLLTLGCVLAFTGSAEECDELAGKLLTTYLAPVIGTLGCAELGRAGVDQADHKLESVCYASEGPTSSVQIVASLRCHTGDRALIPVSVSEQVTADAVVRGSDCTVQSARVRPSGEIGKVLARALDLDGRARKALQEGLAKLCVGGK
jgi:hypothetical protein